MMAYPQLLIAHIDDDSDYIERVKKNLSAKHDDWLFVAIPVDRRRAKDAPGDEKQRVVSKLRTIVEQADQTNRPLLVLLDMSLCETPRRGLTLEENIQGADWLPDIASVVRRGGIIVLSAWGSNLEYGDLTHLMLRLIRNGAYDVIWKEDVAELEPALVRCAQPYDVERIVSLGNEAMVIGRSPSMQRVVKQLETFAPETVTVLIRGESGTGKELAARGIHNLSDRADKTFLPMNCAAISETLLESELFGHEKGSFTGADRRRIGKFEQCHGGTLFLDEIGDMSPLTQAKVLRLLEGRGFERLGGAETIRTDVRLIAATHRPLERMVENGQFRQDLLFRINAFTVTLPPLRERGEDIPDIVHYLVRRHCMPGNKRQLDIRPALMSYFVGYRWPGNIRELSNVILHGIVCDRDGQLGFDDLPSNYGNSEEDSVFVADGLSSGDVHRQGPEHLSRDVALEVFKARITKLYIDNDKRIWMNDLRSVFNGLAEEVDRAWAKKRDDAESFVNSICRFLEDWRLESQIYGTKRRPGSQTDARDTAITDAHHLRKQLREYFCFGTLKQERVKNRPAVKEIVQVFQSKYASVAWMHTLESDVREQLVETIVTAAAETKSAFQAYRWGGSTVPGTWHRGVKVGIENVVREQLKEAMDLASFSAVVRDVAAVVAEALVMAEWLPPNTGRQPTQREGEPSSPEATE